MTNRSGEGSPAAKAAAEAEAETTAGEVGHETWANGGCVSPPLAMDEKCSSHSPIFKPVVADDLLAPVTSAEEALEPVE